VGKGEFMKKAIDITTDDSIFLGIKWEVYDCWADWDKQVMKIFLIYEDGWESRKKKLEVPFDEELQVCE